MSDKASSGKQPDWLVLLTDLHGAEATPEALQQFVNQSAVKQIRVVPPDMTEQDWDRVLQAILDHDKCLTL